MHEIGWMIYLCTTSPLSTSSFAALNTEELSLLPSLPSRPSRPRRNGILLLIIVLDISVEIVLGWLVYTEAVYARTVLLSWFEIWDRTIVLLCDLDFNFVLSCDVIILKQNLYMHLKLMCLCIVRLGIFKLNEYINILYLYVKVNIKCVN